MARDPFPPSPPRARTWLRPWPLLLGGLGLTVLGLLLSAWVPTPVRVLLLGVGLLTAGSAVRRRLATAGQEFEERVESAAVVALAAFTALLAYLGADKDWDAAHLFLGILVTAGLGGALLVLLPSLARRVALSLFLLFHFGGMLTAITSVPPPNGTAPWLSMKLWEVAYRPYLSVLYLTNAYHFYSPDPGPATLVWFRIQYDDGTYRWQYYPNRDVSPTGMDYQRMLALAESVNNPMPRLPLSAGEKAWFEQTTRQTYQHDTWEEIFHRRQIGATLTDPPIPMVEDMTPAEQYREPQDLAKKLIASYARHIARIAPPADNPNAHVKSVKVYRVVHRIVPPQQLAAGRSPTDRTLYMPFYQGEFDADGRLLDPTNPFLYWYLPITFVPPTWPAPGIPIRANPGPMPGARLFDALEIQSGDKITPSPAEQAP